MLFGIRLAGLSKTDIVSQWSDEPVKIGFLKVTTGCSNGMGRTLSFSNFLQRKRNTKLRVSLDS